MSGLSSFSKPYTNDAGTDWADKIDVSPEDLDLVRTRLAETRSEFDRLGRITWWDQVMENLNIVAERAVGTRRRVV